LWLQQVKKISTLKRALWIGNIRPFTRMRKKSGIVVSMPKSHSLMLGYSQEEQKDAIGICEQPRKDPEGTTAPLLVIIGRYKMNQFYELRRLMENITSIITPVKQEEIRTRDDELLGVT
jgi:hypothetical protein